MNENGTLPWKRTKGLWDCLYERGVVQRKFNAKRFAWIRRFLDGAGLVEVQDPTYVIGERAAKWSPSEKFWEVASSLDPHVHLVGAAMFPRHKSLHVLYLAERKTLLPGRGVARLFQRRVEPGPGVMST